MALVKSKLEGTLRKDIQKILTDQMSSMQEDDNPTDIVKTFSRNLAEVVTNAVHDYITSGDIMISEQNIEVIIPTGKSVVVPKRPAKIT